MNNKTKFYLSLVLILVGGMLIGDGQSTFRFVGGIVFLGVFSYLAGVFATKSNIDEEKGDIYGEEE